MDLTKPLALYGAITGTIAIVFSAISAYNNLKDRPWLRLRFRVLIPRHGRIEPSSRHVIVDLSNVGRRPALAYPPAIEYVTSSWDRLVTHSPDEVWKVGFNWIPIPNTGEPPDLDKIEEYETYTYLYRLPSNAKLVRVRVTDSLERRKTKYTFMGSLWLNVFRLRQLLQASRTHGT